MSSPLEREKLRRLFRVYKNVLSMVTLRGFPLNPVYLMKSDRNFIQYDLTPLVPFTFTFEMFLQLRAQTGLFENRSEWTTLFFQPATQEKLLVLFLNSDPGKKVNTENFTIVKAFIQTQQFHHIILISELGLGTDSEGYIDHRTAGYRIEKFTDSEFALDPTKHALAPISIKHIPASNASNWAHEEHLQPNQLPMELTTDPIAKRYGASSGDIMQMVIVGTTTNQQGYARLVRRAPREKKR